MGLQQTGFLILKTGHSLQRLFSTFPDGLAGLGLALLRLGAGIPLIYSGIERAVGAHFQGVAAGHGLFAALGVLLVIGLWTPLAGGLPAAGQLWAALSNDGSRPDDGLTHLILAVLAAGIALLGPGAWSVDPRLFGRKRFR